MAGKTSNGPASGGVGDGSIYATVVPVSTSDTQNDPNGPFEALWIGGAGNVKLITQAGQTKTFIGCANGSFLAEEVKQVYTTNTTATDILGLGATFNGSTIPLSGPIAYWDFEDVATDTIGSRLLAYAAGTSYVAGKLNTKALSLPTGKTASLADSAFNFVQHPFSVLFWAKRATGGTLEVSYKGAIQRCWKANLGATTVTATVDSTGANVVATDTVTIADDTWAMIVLSFDGDLVRLNVNDRTQVTAAATTCGTGATNSLYIAASTATCAIDGLAIFNRCLQPSEIVAHYNSGTGMAYPF